MQRAPTTGRTWRGRRRRTSSCRGGGGSTSTRGTECLARACPDENPTQCTRTRIRLRRVSSTQTTQFRRTAGLAHCEVSGLWGLVRTHRELAFESIHFRTESHQSASSERCPGQARVPNGAPFCIGKTLRRQRARLEDSVNLQQRFFACLFSVYFLRRSRTRCAAGVHAPKAPSSYLMAYWN